MGLQGTTSTVWSFVKTYSHACLTNTLLPSQLGSSPLAGSLWSIWMAGWGPLRICSRVETYKFSNSRCPTHSRVSRRQSFRKKAHNLLSVTGQDCWDQMNQTASLPVNFVHITKNIISYLEAALPTIIFATYFSLHCRITIHSKLKCVQFRKELRLYFGLYLMHYDDEPSNH